MVKIKYLCKSFSTPLTQENLKEEALYPVYGAAGLMGYMDNYSADKEYIGVVKDGAGVGRIDKYPEKSSLLGTMAYIFPNEGTDIDWLKYALMSLELGKNIGATTIPHIYFSQYGNKYVNTPNYNQQQKIANFLDAKCSSIDAVIEKTKASIEEYKKLKQAVITQAVTKGIRPNRKMKDSGIGWTERIPEEWNITKISRIGKTSSGATPLRSKEIDYFEEATIRWIRTLDLNDGVVFDSSEKITELALQNSSCNIMPVGTVCVAMYGGAGTIGKCGILKSECATNQAVCSIVCDEDRMNSMYLLYQLLALKKYWMLYAVGTRKDPNISQEIVGKMNIICPPIEEQIEIVENLKSKLVDIDILIETKYRYLNTIEEYKRSLIFECVTGKKEV